MALLVKIGADLTDFKKEIKNATKEVNEVGKTLTSIGGGLTKYVTTPIIGIGAASIKVGSDFDAGMSEVSAISGATGKDLEALRDKAKEMGATTKFSASDSADAMKYMAMAGWDSQQMISGLPGILNLAAASGEDLATTSDIVTDALTAFGLKASDSTHFADVLAKTSSSANTNVSLMGETFKYVAPLAGTLGFSVEDTSLAIGLMANAGIKGSQAGTALKTAIANMASPTDAMAKKMKELGISITDSKGQTKPFIDIIKDLREKFSKLDKTQQASAASTIFGKEAMSGMLAIINASDDDFNSLYESINSADGAAKQMSDTMQDNLQGDLTTLSSGLEGAGIKISETLAPALRSIVSGITDVVSWFNGLDQSTMDVVVTIGLLVASIGPLLLIVGQGIIWFSKLKEAMSLLQIGAGPLMGSLGSVGTTIASLAIPIAVAVAAFVWMWNTSEEFRVAIGQIFEGVKQIFSGLVDFVTGVFTGDYDLALKGIESITDGFKNIIGGIFDAIVAVFNNVDKFVTGIFKNDWTQSFDYFGDIMNGFSANVLNIWSGVKQIFDGVTGFIKGVFTGDWGAAWQGVVNIFEGIFSTLGGIAKAPLNGVIGIINSAISGINSISIDIPDWVPGVGGSHFGPKIKKLPYLAKGGNVFSGSAIFGEAGPEMLTVSGGAARVTPLSGNGAGNSDFIDYEKMAEAFIRAIRFLKLYVGKDTLAQIIDERLLEVI